MAKVQIDAKRARELAEQIAREISEIQEQKIREIEGEIDKRMDDLGLHGSSYAPPIPTIEIEEDEIAEDIEYALTEGESDRFEVK